jgi:polyisoprenyl-phosphate glycosyltransferase
VTTSSDTKPASTLDVLALIPIYNDWESAALLLDALDDVFAASPGRLSILLIDDGSDQPAPPPFGRTRYRALASVEILRLRRNLGHQRAIAIALAWAEQHRHPATVIVMDGDGEDAPADVPKLLARLEANGHSRIVFAERMKRSEGLVFRAFYAAYRGMHKLVTGIPVKVGNFSAVPAIHLHRLVVVSELWNHYAAAVFKARIPREGMPTMRAHRLSGTSRMNFVSLVIHGLSALSVHAEVIGVRLLVAVLGLAGVLVGLLGMVVGVKYLSALAIPGWATIATGFIVLLLVQLLAFAALFVFIVLHARSQPSFIPLRDHHFFIDGTVRLFPDREGV